MSQSRSYDTPITLIEAVKRLNDGQVVAMPTETVYGLAGVAANDDAVLRIYETKGRPRFNPLIAHCANLEMAKEIAQFSPEAEKLASKFWPGPLTLVLPKKPDAAISDLVTAGLQTIAVRIPAHQKAQELIAHVGKPVAAPSANPSGKLSPTHPTHVIEGFAGTVPVIDGGQCTEGVESTIVAVEKDHLVLLRPGSLSAQQVSTASGMAFADDNTAKIIAPGMLKSHYAPNARVRLNALRAEAGEAFLGFGDVAAGAGGLARNLSSSGDLKEAAKNLFQYLRELDNTGAPSIAVAPIPNEGIGIAINDRLTRAAADRTS